MNLTSMKCEACRADSPRVSEAEVGQYMRQLPGWTIVRQDDVERLQRVFTFKNFAQALEFTNRVGELAEAEQHHPLIITQWGGVTVQWWTHAIHGLHINDFVMAARTDNLKS